MPGNFAQAALCGAAGVLGLATGASGVRDVADACALLLGRNGPPSFKRLVAKVERELEAGLKAEFGGEDAVAPVRATVEQLLARHGRTLRECVELGLDPPRIAAAVLKDGAGLLTDEVKQRKRLCRDLVERVYAAMFADPATINELMPDALRALLGMREQIERLPDAVAERLLDLQMRLILSDGKRLLLGAVRADSMLLRSDYGVVPFYPLRAAAVEGLVGWAEGEAERAVRLIHGPGGAGKSRLLIEVVARLRGRGWRAGFLEGDADRAPPGTFARLVDGDAPVLVAVDYAETRRETLVRLLRRARWAGAPKVRLLLLARTEAEWWRHLGREDRDAREMMGGHADSLALGPLPDDEAARRAVFDAAAAAFAGRLGVAAAAAAAPDLSGSHFANMLFVHLAALAALAAVRGRRVEDAEDLLRHVVDRDRGAWELGLDDFGLPRGQYRTAVAQAATLATIAAGAGGEEALAAMVADAPELGGAPAAAVGSVARLLARLYPDHAGMGALRPDLLGEHLAGEELRRGGALLDAAFGERAVPARLKSGLTVLTRLALRRPDSVDLVDAALLRHAERLGQPAIEVAVELGGPVLDRLADVVRRAGHTRRTALADSLAPQLPWPSVVARELAVEVGSALAEAQRRRTDGDTEEGRGQLAASLSNLGIHLSELNRREAALAAAEEAAGLYRELAVARPDAFRPDLAMALNNLANRLSALGRREAALAAAEEAAAIRRELAAARPDVFNANLARSLYVLADQLEGLQRLRDATDANREAASLLAPLFLRLPAAFASLMAAVAAGYRRRTALAGLSADEALLGLVETKLAELAPG